MNKVLLMVMSGVITVSMSSSWAMNQSEMVDAVATQTGLSKKDTYNALDAFEKQLKAEMGAKKAVKLDGFGQYNPREKMGMRTGKTFGGGTTEYENWKLVKKPVVIDEATFNARASQRAGISEAEYDKVLEAYKNNVGNTLRKGGSVAMHGEGTYAVQRVASRVRTNADGTATRIPAHKRVRYNGFGNQNKQQFKADAELNCRLGNC